MTFLNRNQFKHSSQPSRTKTKWATDHKQTGGQTIPKTIIITKDTLRTQRVSVIKKMTKRCQQEIF